MKVWQIILIPLMLSGLTLLANFFVNTPFTPFLEYVSIISFAIAGLFFIICFAFDCSLRILLKEFKK